MAFGSGLCVAPRLLSLLLPSWRLATSMVFLQLSDVFVLDGGQEMPVLQ